MSDYLRPTSIAEAAKARAEHPEWMVLAGGTDLLVGADKAEPPVGVLDLFGCEALVGIREEGGSIVVGAATPYAHLIRSELVRRELPCLVAAAREIGAMQIQARGTLGGNIATSSPVGDSLPCLLALDAEIELASVRGDRRVPYAEFCTGYRTTKMAPDELIAAVRFPPRPAGLIQYWRKVGTRRAQSISKVMIAGAAHVTGGAIDHARVALGAVADRPIRVAEVEEALVGQAPSAELADEAAEIVGRTVTPIDDIRSRARYRLHVAQNLVRRFVGTVESAS